MCRKYPDDRVQAYDGHMNMVLSDVEEQISTLEIDEATNIERIQVGRDVLMSAKLILTPVPGRETQL